jgi:hypothetical protein
VSDTQNRNCLDAEALAAWVDGGLSGEALVRARTHVADCARCQAIVAVMVRTEAAVAAPAERPARRWLGWLVPLAAAATAVAIWVAVPGTPIPPLAKAVKEEAAAPVAPPAAPAEGRRQAAARDEAQSAAKLEAKKRDDAARANKEIDRFAARDAVVATPPPTVAAERVLGQAAARAEIVSIEVVSPDPLVRWRIRAARLEKSSDAGKTWDAVTSGVASELTSGSAPSATVCWLVGRAGVILLTTDGRTWRRVTFPETTDLSAVRATDAKSATVTTADGREWSTTDGGATWRRNEVGTRF